ncbi:hypothetical protein E1297_13215, partial [Roseibium sp. RKSG952]|nr:hypothetical protein [Roseibium sp. RKSG952]
TADDNDDTADNGNGGTVVTPDSWNGTAGVTAATASVVVTWNWGNDQVVNGFNPASDTIFIDWFEPSAIDVSEVNGDVVFTMASNNQTITLADVSLDDLSADNFTIMRESTGQEILSQVGAGSDSSDGTNNEAPSDDNDNGGTGADAVDAWSSSAIYTRGDVVAVGNAVYEANWWTSGTDPANANGGPGTGQPWTYVGTTDEFGADNDNADTDGDDTDTDTDTGGDDTNTDDGNTNTGDDGTNTDDGDTGGDDTTDDGDDTSAVGVHTRINLESQSQTITGFDTATDMLHIEHDIFADQLVIADTGDDLTVYIYDENGSLLSETVVEGINLADLTEANLLVIEEDAYEEVMAQLEQAAAGNDDGTDDGNADADDDAADDSDDTMDDMDDHEDDHDMTDGAVMTMITLDSTSQTIADFDPAMDMIHIEQGIYADQLVIADTGHGLTFYVYDENGSLLSQTVFTDTTLSDLTMANFSVAEEDALNEVAASLGQEIETSTTGNGFEVEYDTDGSNPPVITGTSDMGGNVYQADFGADDIVGFDINSDVIDLGSTSVHGMIINMTPDGEPIIDNPWGSSMQVVQGVQLSDLSIENFGIVGNEHFRQDLGGVLSWEQGVGPRDSDTVYIRSHEYGVTEVIDNFDPATMKISFLYYGTRERLVVEDTDQGLMISNETSGQTFYFTGVEKADLIPGNVEFHHDQVIEDNLEAPFGFDQNDVTLVSRNDLLTPTAPAGETTDGWQTQTGVGAYSDGTEPEETSTGPGALSSDGGEVTEFGNGQDTLSIEWDYATVNVITGFDPAEDQIDFGVMGVDNVSVWEDGDDLAFTVNDNGGQTYYLEGIQAEDLGLDNLTGPEWNDIVTADGGIADQLVGLGNTDPELV